MKQVWKGGFETKASAEAALNETMVQLSAGTHVQPSRQTFAEYIRRDWLPSLRTAVEGKRLKPSTFSFYLGLAETHVIPRIGGVLLSKVDPPLLNRLYLDLMSTTKRDGEPLSPTTVHAAHRTVSKALAEALVAGLVSRNAAKLAKPPRPAKTEMSTWDASQLRAFAASVASDRLSALWQVAMTTGLRRGELAGLRWEDLDLDNQRLRVAVTRVAVNYRVEPGTPKSATSRRTIGLDPETCASLRSHRARMAAERLAWGPAWTDCGLVFVAEDGEALHPQRFSKLFQVAARRAKLPPIRFHDLRHSYASAGLEAGVPLLVMSRRLGHSSLAITADTYSHVRPQVDQEAADRTAAYIFGARS
jgi:integrase